MFGKSKAKVHKMEWEGRWGDLATYNSEVARGIVHTEAYDLKMAKKQEAFQRWYHEEMHMEGTMHIHSPDDPYYDGHGFAPDDPGPPTR